MWISPGLAWVRCSGMPLERACSCTDTLLLHISDGRLLLLDSIRGDVVELKLVWKSAIWLWAMAAVQAVNCLASTALSIAPRILHSYKIFKAILLFLLLDWKALMTLFTGHFFLLCVCLGSLIWIMGENKCRHKVECKSLPGSIMRPSEVVTLRRLLDHAYYWLAAGVCVPLGVFSNYTVYVMLTSTYTTLMPSSFTAEIGPALQTIYI